MFLPGQPLTWTPEHQEPSRVEFIRYLVGTQGAEVLAAGGEVTRSAQITELAALPEAPGSPVYATKDETGDFLRASNLGNGMIRVAIGRAQVNERVRHYFLSADERRELAAFLLDGLEG